ncbi:MAG: hypothetical protein K1X64_07760 [Myxococcaceae bacterium]|nr:hypothetical protein [Myxococcaceae bacterium]
MSIPKIGSGNLTQQKVEETAPQQAPGAESGFSGSSSFSNKDVQLKATSSALLGVDVGGAIRGERASSLGGSLFGNNTVTGFFGDDGSKSTSSNFFNDSTSAPSNSELGPLGDLFKGDNTFSTMVKNSFNKTTNSVGNKMIDAIKEGVGEGGGKGLGKMSKETEKKFWDIYFMKNILNGSKEAWKAQEKAMKKALKDAGVNVPDDSNSHVDLPSMWDLWAMSEGKKIDAPPYLVKTMLGGQKATEAEKKEYEAMMKA